jgi:phage/plasmid-associated DNA primase
VVLGLWVEDRKKLHYTVTRRHVTETVGKTVGPTPKEQKALIQAAHIHAIVVQVQSHGQVAALPEQFNRDEWLLNTPGGVVDLRNGEIRTARKEDYLTRTTPVAPDKNTPTPVLMSSCLTSWAGSYRVKPANAEPVSAASSSLPKSDDCFTRWR